MPGDKDDGAEYLYSLIATDEISDDCRQELIQIYGPNYQEILDEIHRPEGPVPGAAAHPVVMRIFSLGAGREVEEKVEIEVVK